MYTGIRSNQSSRLPCSWLQTLLDSNIHVPPQIDHPVDLYQHTPSESRRVRPRVYQSVGSGRCWVGTEQENVIKAQKTVMAHKAKDLLPGEIAIAW
jgi:hypothetical protein